MIKVFLIAYVQCCHHFPWNVIYIIIVITFVSIFLILFHIIKAEIKYFETQIPLLAYLFVKSGGESTKTIFELISSITGRKDLALCNSIKDFLEAMIKSRSTFTLKLAFAILNESYDMCNFQKICIFISFFYYYYYF